MGIEALRTRIEAAKQKNVAARQARVRKRHAGPIVSELSRQIFKKYGASALCSDTRMFQLIKPHMRRHGYDKCRLILEYAIENWDRLRNDIFGKWTHVPDYPAFPFVCTDGVFNKIEFAYRRDVLGETRLGVTRTYSMLEGMHNSAKATIQKLQEQLKQATHEITSNRQHETRLRRALDDATRKIVEMKSKMAVVSATESASNKISRSSSDLLSAEIAFASRRLRRDSDLIHEWNLYP